MTKAEEIVRNKFECSYKYSANLGDIWAMDGTDSMKVHYTIILIQLLTKITGGKNTGSCIIVKEHFR